MANGKAIPKNRLFLSYASQDSVVAARISGALRQAGASVGMVQFELQVGDSISHRIRGAMSASDYLVVLLSPASVNSRWVRMELGVALAREIHARDITVIPVIVADCDVPAELATKHVFDLRDQIEERIPSLVRQLGTAPSIDFTALSGHEFESLVADLLGRLGFYDIELGHMVEGKQFDICARHVLKDPLGQETEETWLVEVMHYRHERASVHKISITLANLDSLSARYQGLLVVSGQLTSAARDYLAHTSERGRPRLRIIDGTELKRLLLAQYDLVSRYFSGAPE